MELDKYTRKIVEYKDKDIYIVFYSDTCPYSLKAIELLRRSGKEFKGYRIENRNMMNDILDKLTNTRNLTNYDVSHKTKPIIFHKGEFKGGYTELTNIIEDPSI